MVWRRPGWCKRRRRSHGTRHGVQSQRDPTTTSRYGAGTEETGGFLGAGLAKDEVAQAKQEPHNAARGPDPAISDDDVEVRGRDGRNSRLSWCWSGKTGYRKAGKAGATKHGMGSRPSGIRRRRRCTGQGGEKEAALLANSNKRRLLVLVERAARHSRRESRTNSSIGVLDMKEGSGRDFDENGGDLQRQLTTTLHPTHTWLTCSVFAGRTAEVKW